MLLGGVDGSQLLLVCGLVLWSFFFFFFLTSSDREEFVRCSSRLEISVVFGAKLAVFVSSPLPPACLLTSSSHANTSVRVCMRRRRQVSKGAEGITYVPDYEETEVTKKGTPWTENSE